MQTENLTGFNIINHDDPFITGMIKATLIWSFIYAVIRVITQLLNEKSVKSKHGLSHRVYVIIYTFYCLILGSIQFQNLDHYIQNMYNPSMHEYEITPLTNEQAIFFFMISGFEIADVMIRLINNTLGTVFIIHHILHLIAYAYGGLIWRQYGSGFMVHLLLSEWRDIVYVWIKVFDQLYIKYKLLHYLDAVFVVIVVPMLWKFAYHVMVYDAIPYIYKVSIMAYGVMLGVWLKDRLKWNWKKTRDSSGDMKKETKMK